MASRTVYCICGEPYDSVRFMIQCDSCKDWYHGRNNFRHPNRKKMVFPLFYDRCVNVKEHESSDIEKYHCVQCQKIVGPSILREVKNYHRHDYGDGNADGKNIINCLSLAVQSGTSVFVKELRSRHFKSDRFDLYKQIFHQIHKIFILAQNVHQNLAKLLREMKKEKKSHNIYVHITQNKSIQAHQDIVFISSDINLFSLSHADDIVIRLRGPQLSLPYLIQNGFNYPILVDSTVGLGLQMPSDSFTVSDVMDYIGPNFPLDVIDVARQENIRMPMSEWVEYFNSPVRNKVYNVISLEFSKTRLSDLVKPPSIVQKLSWVENYWPKNSETHTPYCPQVMKYCLMSAQDSYTDFHIDFGGTSVWYHILRFCKNNYFKGKKFEMKCLFIDKWKMDFGRERFFIFLGEKIFFLIQPTPANLALYEHWMASSNQSETFFGDQVDVCYQMTLTQGQTLFIPTGWIHAVLTPDDSLVFGGNFLHSLNIPVQLHIHEMEKRINTPEKYKFPTFETVHWFAAPNILEQLRDNNVSKRELSYLVTGAKALVSVLKIWSSDSQYDFKTLRFWFLGKETLNHKHDDVPPGINVTKLIKDLMKEVRIAEKYASSKNPMVAARKPPVRQKRKEVVAKQRVEKILKMVPTESEKNLNLVSQYPLKPKISPNSDIFYDDFPFHSQNPDMQLHMQDSKMMLDKMNIDIKSFLDSASLKEGAIIQLVHRETLCSCVTMYTYTRLWSPRLEDKDIEHFKDGNFPLKKESVYDFVDSDDDNLIVDENPVNCRKREFKKEHFAQDVCPDVQPVNGKPVEGSFNPNSLLNQPPHDDSNADTPKNATIDDLLLASGLAVDGDSSVSLGDDELNINNLLIYLMQ
ncbi:UNVERIFIED_CONTAM: kdm7a [Trichonephila clavipes]